jgi:hypothetical protein
MQEIAAGSRACEEKLCTSPHSRLSWNYRACMESLRQKMQKRHLSPPMASARSNIGLSTASRPITRWSLPTFFKARQGL